MPVVIFLLIVIVLLLGGWVLLAVAGVVAVATLGGALMALTWLWQHTWPFLATGLALCLVLGMLGNMRTADRQKVVNLLRTPPKQPGPDASRDSARDWFERNGQTLPDAKRRAFEERLKSGR